MTGIELFGLRFAVGRPHEHEVVPERFRIAAGQVGAVIVPPPAGIVLADVLTGLAGPSGGEVRVGDENVTGRRPGHRGIALVPADGGLLPHLTVERNVGYGIARSGTRGQREARVERELGRFELASLRRLRPHQLSAEQRLRVAVARAKCLPERTCAVVVEDRGSAACRAAVVTAAGDDLAVVVITGGEDRARELGARTLARCRPVFAEAREKPAEPEGPEGTPSDAGQP